jgi:protein-S-isoprenylcysteine O-methyltransferase Ste14
MDVLDHMRYTIALVLTMTGPGAAVFWLPVHPLARFWRRVGFGWAYLVGFGIYGLMAFGAWRYRAVLLSVEFGTNTWTMAAGAGFVLASVLVRRARRQLSIGTRFGLPELAPHRFPQRLLTEGAYARVRHPRYLEVILGFTGYALFANYLAPYAAAALVVAAILVVIRLEERELRDRFGAEYETYRARVPKLVPRVDWKRIRGR